MTTNNLEAEKAFRNMKKRIERKGGKFYDSGETGIIYYTKTTTKEEIREIINASGSLKFDGPESENEKLRKLIEEKDKQIAKLKESDESKAAAWGYIKAGALIILIGTLIGLINNPNMFRSASKKFAATANYVKSINASKNNINVFARGLSYFYKRVVKFVTDNQTFAMCFALGAFLIGVGIWKRYF